MSRPHRTGNSKISVIGGVITTLASAGLFGWAVISIVTSIVGS